MTEFGLEVLHSKLLLTPYLSMWIGQASAGYFVRCTALCDAYGDGGVLTPGTAKKGQVIIDKFKGT